jgi:hypothetical protein
MKTNLRKIIREELTVLSNFDKLMNSFKSNFPQELHNKVDSISSYVKDYVRQNGFNIKFLNSCRTGFKGVRTNQFIIICSPMQMENIGDFLYTIFHEIRHEEQMSKFKISNPLTGQLEDFEKLFKEYWKLELDADEFAKRKISELILNLNIPVDITKKNFRLSPYVENYPSASKMIENHLRMVVTDIKNMKKSGMEYSDIADHPIVKNHLEKLEEFF